MGVCWGMEVGVGVIGGGCTPAGTGDPELSESPEETTTLAATTDDLEASPLERDDDLSPIFAVDEHAVDVVKEASAVADVSPIFWILLLLPSVSLILVVSM